MTGPDVPDADLQPRSSSGGSLRAGRLLAAPAILIVLAGGWILFGRQSAVIGSAPPRPPVVVTSTPLLRSLDVRLDFLGHLSAVDQVELRAQVGGTLTGIHFRDGALVRRGELLFSIDPRPYQVSLSRAQALLESASARLVLANQESARARVLQAGDAGTVENVDQRSSELRAAKAAIDDAKAQVRDARLDLEHSRIRSPFTGRIGSHLVSVGTLVAGSRSASSPTTLLATIVSLDPVHMDLDMSETEFATFQRYRASSRVASPDRVSIAVNGSDDFDRAGVLDFVDNTLDRTSGTIRVRATIANPTLDLTPGAFAEARLAVVGPKPTMLVPDAAVMPDQSRHLVLTVNRQGTVVSRTVEIGDVRGGLRVIRSGLAPNDRVIINGLPFATPGAKVTVKAGSIHYADAG